jgi:hypothetical protein
MGVQMQNKPARLCVPDITTPYAAKHITLKSIPKRRSRKNMTVYNDIIAQHIGLEEALEALKTVVNLPVTVAEYSLQHSCKNDLQESKPITVSGDYLNVLIEQHFGDADEETIANVQSVKECLPWLADKLQESLFVDITAPMA